MIGSDSKTYVRRPVGKRFDNRCKFGTFKFGWGSIKVGDVFRNLELNQFIK